MTAVRLPLVDRVMDGTRDGFEDEWDFGGIGNRICVAYQKTLGRRSIW